MSNEGQEILGFSGKSALDKMWEGTPIGGPKVNLGVLEAEPEKGSKLTYWRKEFVGVLGSLLSKSAEGKPEVSKKIDGFVEERFFTLEPDENLDFRRDVSVVVIGEKVSLLENEEKSKKITILAFPGIMSWAKPYVDLAQYLGVKDFNMYIFGLPGHMDTYSPKPGVVTLEKYANDVAKIVKKEGAKNLLLIASSLGGPVAMHLAKILDKESTVGEILDNPLVVRLGGVDVAKTTPPWLYDMASHFIQTLVSEEKPAKQPGELEAGFLHKGIRPGELIPALKLLGKVDEERLKGVDVPTVLMYGRRDPVLRTREEHLEAFRGGQFVTKGKLVEVGQKGGHSKGVLFDPEGKQKLISSMYWSVQYLRDRWLREKEAT